jgi:hypothetical protein
MMQVLSRTSTMTLTPGSTAAQVLSAMNARLVQFQADPDNAGTVTILGVTAGAANAAGPVLAAGDWSPSLWVSDLSQLAYKLSDASDSVHVLVCR